MFIKYELNQFICLIFFFLDKTNIFFSLDEKKQKSRLRLRELKPLLKG